MKIGYWNIYVLSDNSLHHINQDEHIKILFLKFSVFEVHEFFTTDGRK